MLKGDVSWHTLDLDGILIFAGRICIMRVRDLIELIAYEAHCFNILSLELGRCIMI